MADFDERQPASAAAGEALRELRARAERRRLVTQSPPPETPAEMQRLVQELQVHQIELEMQYEELLLAQAEAEASRVQYLDLYEFAPVGYCTLDATGTLRQLNLRTAQLLGLVRQQLQGRRLALFVELRQRAEFAGFLNRVLTADPTDSTRHAITLALVRPDGRPLELRLEATCAHDAATNQPLARLALLDVTEQQQATRALAESEQRLRQALDAAAMGVVSWDFATDQWQADARAQAIWGLPYAAAPRPADVVAAHLHPADQARFRQLAAPAAAPPAGVEVELRRPDAQRPDRYVSLTGHVLAPEPAHPQGRLLGLVRDRTLHHRTAQELSYKTQLLERILGHLPVLLGRLDAEGRYRELVGAGLRRLHLADNELVGQSIFDCFPSINEHSRRLLAGESINFMGSTDLNGERMYYQTYGFFDAERNEVIMFALDVTEREQQRTETTRLQLRQQQLVLSAILTTQEEERRRIAEALHNGVGQLLYATRLHLTQLPDSETLRAGQQLLQEAIRATRNISFELTPRILEDFGLPTALRELADRVPVSLLHLDLRLQGLEDGTEPLPPPVQMAAYRIVQELLSNVMKHAQARQVTLAVTRQQQQLCIHITDDGVGFVPAPTPASGGIGLAGIRNRVELLGGTLAISSQPGQGTTISIALLLPPDPDSAAS
ncbi:ATP-binding protein [Hymenobacter psychrophilus]|uniref:histidine kinase n=1 Tax=Hymenobacter psychrophilus TaxID=651662 RepID=A0A1H3LT51_9BACT|nr:ATP-binding protein [Hymenobacter psychrophilus]SDY67025.1 PAS domain S-box-containing protein [Hymenobacter psychrophilus]